MREDCRTVTTQPVGDAFRRKITTYDDLSARAKKREISRRGESVPCSTNGRDETENITAALVRAEPTIFFIQTYLRRILYTERIPSFHALAIACLPATPIPHDDAARRRPIDIGALPVASFVVILLYHRVLGISVDIFARPGSPFQSVRLPRIERNQ